jgi:hypothetical protein
MTFLMAAILSRREQLQVLNEIILTATVGSSIAPARYTMYGKHAVVSDPQT